MDLCLAHHSADYPGRLAMVPDAPKRLFWRGAFCNEASPWVAIVGARAASGADRERAHEMAYSVAMAGGVVVSGGALGTDAAAHRGALAAGGVTVAVLAAGLEKLYPRTHTSLFVDVVEGGGALVSPYEPLVPPRRYHFVRRNRIIAGLCDLVIVVSASQSSGALYTARAAHDYRRRLAAVPGTPGCEALLAEGALAIESSSQVVGAARGEFRDSSVRLPDSALERAVLRSLGKEPVSAEQLADILDRSPRQIDCVLSELELGRLALALPGRLYVRSALAAELG